MRVWQLLVADIKIDKKGQVVKNVVLLWFHPPYLPGILGDGPV